MLPAGQTGQLALWDAVNHKLSDRHTFDEISHPLQPKCACINICTGSANTMRRALFCSELALTDVSGQTWWGLHTWRAPLAISFMMIFMTPHKPSNWRSKVDVSRILAQDLPKLGPVLTAGASYTSNPHIFLRTRLKPSVGVYESH